MIPIGRNNKPPFFRLSDKGVTETKPGYSARATIFTTIKDKTSEKFIRTSYFAEFYKTSVEKAKQLTAFDKFEVLSGTVLRNEWKDATGILRSGIKLLIFDIEKSASVPALKYPSQELYSENNSEKRASHDSENIDKKNVNCFPENDELYIEELF